MKLAGRLWLVLAVLVIVSAVLLRGSRAHTAVAMRSEHSQPARTLPKRLVAVVPDGKQFHDPACRFIHGKPEMMTAEKAVAAGYTPDPRCMKAALQKH
jgi:hypothetical protein